MVPFTAQVHTLIKSVLRAGDLAVDATVGNGHDTRFLAECVGPHGHVYGFDIQTVAVDNLRRVCEEEHVDQVTLHCASHAEMMECLPVDVAGRVGAITFNLGYLPGGDKSITTLPASTCTALTHAVRLLRCDGVLTVLAYPGHPGGAEEVEEVGHLLWQLSNEFSVIEPQPCSNPASPRLFVVRRLNDSARSNM